MVIFHNYVNIYQRVKLIWVHRGAPLLQHRSPLQDAAEGERTEQLCIHAGYPWPGEMKHEIYVWIYTIQCTTTHSLLYIGSFQTVTLGQRDLAARSLAQVVGGEFRCGWAEPCTVNCGWF